MSQSFNLVFNRGNGRETWHEPFATINDAVSEADSLLEFGNAWWFQIESGGNVIMEHEAVMAAIVEMATVEDEDA